MNDLALTAAEDAIARYYREHLPGRPQPPANAVRAALVAADPFLVAQALVEAEGEDMSKQAEFRAAEPGTTFLAFGAHVQSGVGGNLAEGEARALVQMTLPGKWNHGAEDNLQVYLDPDVADQLSIYLAGASVAAREDLARFEGRL